MRNDDPEYIGQLEQALAAAEEELKQQDVLISHLQDELGKMQELLSPTCMGEPRVKLTSFD